MRERGAGVERQKLTDHWSALSRLRFQSSGGLKVAFNKEILKRSFVFMFGYNMLEISFFTKAIRRTEIRKSKKLQRLQFFQAAETGKTVCLKF